MIVISRKTGESVILNDVITVTIVEVRGDKVRLGIVSPKEVGVHRLEVYQAIQGQLPPSQPLPVRDRWAPEPARPAPPPAVPPAPPGAGPEDRVVLTDAQVAALDRFRASIRAARGAAVSREDALGTLLAAVEAAGRNLPAFLFESIRGRDRP